MAGAAETELLTKNAWAAGFLVAALELAVPVLGGLAFLTARAYRTGDTAIGILLTAMWALVGGGWAAGVLLGLAFGWARAGRWQVHGFMAVWTALVLLALANFALSAVMKKMPVEDWRAWFGWLPAF